MARTARRQTHFLSVSGKLVLRVVIGFPLAVSLLWLPIANVGIRACVAIGSAFIASTVIAFLLDRS
jgi:hypothetical protein